MTLTSAVILPQQDILQLFAERLAQTRIALPGLCAVDVSAAFGEHRHFTTARGLACTIGSPGCFHVVLSEKLTRLPRANVDAVTRHELGHIVDFSTIAADLDTFARHFGITLAATPERRADAIAGLIWGEPIGYDASLVQVLGAGTVPRPESLGL